MAKRSLIERLRTRLTGAVFFYLAEPVAHSGAASESLREVLKPGDVLLSEGNTRMAALVRRITRSSWSHVAMYVGPLEEGRDPRCVVEAHFATGVRAVPLSEFDGQRTRVLRPAALGDADRQRIADWVVRRIGNPYDLAHAWALAKWLLRLTPSPRAMAHDAKHFICSSLLAHAFLFIGYPIAASDTRALIPGDFESASGFDVVKDSHRL
jgi:uncharacterized protein YycO